jgi:hypothetical protein
MPKQAETELLGNTGTISTIAFGGGHNEVPIARLFNDFDEGQQSNSDCGRPCHNCAFRFSCTTARQQTPPQD